MGGGREGEEEGVGSVRETEREEDCGLAVVEISSLHFYLVSGYHGDPNHDYICAHVCTYPYCIHLHRCIHRWISFHLHTLGHCDR